MRVLLRELPLMLRDVVTQALARQPGVEIVTEPPVPLPAPAAAPPPDLVIVATEDPDGNGAPAVLQRWPNSRVLLITAAGDRGSLVQLQPHRTSLGELSLAALVGLVTELGQGQG